jgi:hypothetical protein
VADASGFELRQVADVLTSKGPQSGNLSVTEEGRRMSDIDDVLERLVTEPGFRAQLAEDPTGALAGYALDSADLEVLAATLDEGAAAEHGVEQRTSKSAFLQAVMGFLAPGGGTGSDAGGDLAVPEPTSPATDAFLELDGVEGESTRPPEPPGELAASGAAAGGTWTDHKDHDPGVPLGTRADVHPDLPQQPTSPQPTSPVGPPPSDSLAVPPGGGDASMTRSEPTADEPATDADPNRPPFDVIELVAHTITSEETTDTEVIGKIAPEPGREEDPVESVSMSDGKVTSPSPGTLVEGAGGGDAAGKTDDLGRVKPVFSHSPKNETDATPTDPSMASTRDEPLLPEGESPASPGNLAVPEPGQEDKDHKGWSDVVSFSHSIQKGSGADETFEDLSVDPPAPSDAMPFEDAAVDPPSANSSYQDRVANEAFLAQPDADAASAATNDPEFKYAPVRRSTQSATEGLQAPDAATSADGKDPAIEEIVIVNEGFERASPEDASEGTGGGLRDARDE